MKIELNLTAEEIFSIHTVINPVYAAKAITREGKVIQSIGFELADKFDSKQKSLKKKQNLFDTKKRHKVSLKAYEADALEKILINQRQYLDIPYMLNHVQKVIDTLNQKLA